MKKLLITLLLAVFAMPAHAWVFLDDITVKGKVSPYLAEKVVRGEPIRICVDFIETSKDDAARKINKRYLEGYKRDNYYKQVSYLINNAIAAHLGNVVFYIQKSGRQAEFADILKYLNNPKIVYVNSGKDKDRNCDSYGYDNSAMDLRVMLEVNDDLRSYLLNRNTAGTAANAERHSIKAYFHPDYIDDNWINIWGSKNGGIADSKQMHIAESILFMPIITHELGHAFGLADQYEGGKSRNDVYTLGGIMELSSIQSIMNSPGKKLECDDAEGIINLLDYYSQSSSKRRTNGWASLCWNKIMYIESYPAKISSDEYKAQLKYAADKYIGNIPAHIKRIKGEKYAESKRDAEAAAKADADYEQRIKEHLKAVDEAGTCPVCGKNLLSLSGGMKELSAPRVKVTEGNKVSYKYPYGQCKVKMHIECWKEYKEKGLKFPWKKWCESSK